MHVQTVKEFFQQLPSLLDPDAADGVAVTYQFDLSGEQGGQYTLTVKDGSCSVSEGTHQAADVTFSMSGEDCVAILKGQLDGMGVFMSGRLKVSGDLTEAIRLKVLFPTVR
jgi:putative sterol carrier protein